MFKSKQINDVLKLGLLKWVCLQRFIIVVNMIKYFNTIKPTAVMYDLKHLW